ncbi:centromere-associated protein E-like [Phycodurus eques]|uniref:centromere-associated protein E-like n=1 Tax=Phycodurus eques TaxID=693459 RepID=UPI002ACE9146|nr:centromere-associated protein E-like [Phycodurus eques]
MQKSITHLNQELNRNGKEVLQFKHEIKHITNVMTVIVKHIEKIWPQMQRHTQIQKAASTGIKLKEIVEKYSMLENNGQQLGDIIKHTVNTRKHMEKDKITLYPKNKVNAKIHKIFIEEKRLRKHLARRLNAKEYTKRKIKCMRYQVKKKHQELDQRLQRTMKERDELEILKLKLQKQRDELDEKQNDLMQTMETMAKHCCRGAQHVQVHVNEMTRMKSAKRDKMNLKNPQFSRWKYKDPPINKLDVFPSNEEGQNETYKEVKDDTLVPSDRPKTEMKMIEEILMAELIKQRERTENEAYELRVKEEKLRKTIENSMDDMKGKNQEVNRLIMDINNLQRPKTQTKDFLSKEEYNEDTEKELDQRNYKNKHWGDLLSDKHRKEEEKKVPKITQPVQEIYKFNSLREDVRREKQQLDGKDQVIKQELQELELLETELDIKKKQSEQALRKLMRKFKAMTIIWFKMKQERGLMNEETKKKEKEFGKMQEKIIKERDGLELLRCKLQQQKELSEKRHRSTEDLTVVISGCNNLRIKYLESMKVQNVFGKTNKEQISSKVNKYLIGIHDIMQKISIQLETIRKKMEILENAKSHLCKQIACLTTFKRESKTLTFDVRMKKERLMIPFKKEIHEMLDIRKEMQIQKIELDIKRESLKRETKEAEVLKSELEIKQKHKLNLLRKLSRIEQHNKKKDAEIKLEEKSLKRETRKRQKELNRHLERVIKEMDRLEILKWNIQRCQKESTMSMVTKVSNQSQNNCDIISKYMEIHAIMRTHCEYMTQTIHDIKQKISKQQKITTNTKYEVSHIRFGLKKGNEICHLKKITQEVIEIIKRRKNGLELLKYDLNKTMAGIQLQITFLEKRKELMKETTNELEITICEIRHNKKNLCGRNQLGSVLKYMVKKREDLIEMKEDVDANTDRVGNEREKLLSMVLKHTKLLQRERIKLEGLLSSMVKQKEEFEEKREHFEAVVERVSKEREKVISIKNNVEADRRSLAIEKEMIKQLQSDLKVWEDHILTNTQSQETKKTLLQEVNEKKLENIYKKVLKLKANKDDVEKVSVALKNTLASLDQTTDKGLKYNELLHRERIKMDGLLSTMVKQIEEFEEKRVHVEAAIERVSNDKENVISMKNNVDADRRSLAIEKEEIEQLQSDLKVWEDHLLTNTQSLETKKILLREP